jgi:hypothetical protein
MLSAYADAARILKRQDYLDIAISNANFVRRELYQVGRFKHSYKDGKVKIEGLLEDYAYYALGLLALYRATFDPQWFYWALELAQTILEHFHDAEHGGFFTTANDGEKLITRLKDYFDSPNPGENAATAELLVMLARYTSKTEWEDLAAATMRPMAEALGKHPNGFGTLLFVLELLLSAEQEIALLGEPDEPDLKALLAEVNKLYLPRVLVALARDPNDPIVQTIAFLQNRERVKGKASAYVCEAGACKLPVNQPEALAEQLKAIKPY